MEEERVKRLEGFSIAKHQCDRLNTALRRLGIHAQGRPGSAGPASWRITIDMTPENAGRLADAIERGRKP